MVVLIAKNTVKEGLQEEFLKIAKEKHWAAHRNVERVTYQE